MVENESVFRFCQRVQMFNDALSCQLMLVESDRTLVRGIPESSEATVFLRSPAPLCQNMKNMKKAGLPQAYPQWLVVAIRKQEGHVAASLGHVDLTQLLDSGFSSSSSSSPSSSSSSSSSSSTLPTCSHSYNTRHKKGKEGKQEKEEKEEEKVVEGSSGESDSSSSSDDEKIIFQFINRLIFFLLCLTPI